MTSDQLLSPEDVAGRCGLSRRAVYDAIRRGELPAMRLCNRLRTRTEDYEAWLSAARVGPSPSPAAVSVTDLRSRSKQALPAGSFRALIAEGGGPKRDPWDDEPAPWARR